MLAAVEFKYNSATEFTMDRRNAALAALHYYPQAILLLYIHKTKRWYRIDPQTRRAVSIDYPTPGIQPISAFPKPPFTMPKMNTHGRLYSTKITTEAVGFAVDLLEFGVNAIFGPKKKKRPPRKK